MAHDPHAQGPRTGPSAADPTPGGAPPTGGYGPGPATGTATLPPWQAGPAGPPTAPAPRRRRAGPIVAAALAGALIAGGAGGAVGYGVAASQDGSSVLAGASTGGSASSAAPAPAGSVEAVAQQVLPSVVQLRGASGEGSGIVVSADGLILTNAHVLEAGRSQASRSPFGGLTEQGRAAPQGLSAVFQNGTSAPVDVVGTDVTADLAVVRARGVADLTPARLGDSEALAVGQQVVAVGSPLGLSGTVTSGIVSALQRPVAAGGAGSGQSSVLDAVQTDAAINPGNSGGALVDMQGRVVGVTSAIASLGSSSGGGQQSGSIGLGFAIPIAQAARIGDELARQGYADQAVLGSTVGDAPGAAGAVLGTLSPGGAAAAAGLAPGDVVTRVGDRPIDGADGLVAAIRSRAPGSPVTLTVSTGNAAPRAVGVTLGTERAPSA